MNSKIGIGITTRDRNEVFAYTLSRLVEHLPKDCTLAIVDDNSKVPVVEADYRFENNVGVARAKNKCLELLKDCDHIFLFCLLYTSPSPRDRTRSRMPSSA